MAEISETSIPGVGTRFEFVTSTDQRVGVVRRRTGRVDILVYDLEDPDACRDVLALSEEDSRTLAELLGGSSVAQHLARLQQSVEGLAIDWLLVGRDTPYVDRTIGDTRARTRTGASVVTVLRHGTAFPTPGPEFVLEADDTLVVVGTARGIEALSVILRTG